MRYIRRNKRIIRANNAINPATTTSKKWGFAPVPGKGGATTNYDSELTDLERREIVYGRKRGTANA